MSNLTAAEIEQSPSDALCATTEFSVVASTKRFDIVVPTKYQIERDVLILCRNPKVGASNVPAAGALDPILPEVDRSDICSLPLSSCSSLAPPIELLNHSLSDNDDSSAWRLVDFKSPKGGYRPNFTPSQAKALSSATGRLYTITSLDPDDLDAVDELQVDGMILHGYIDGKPIYYKYSGMHADLKAIETETVFGLRYVRQPVESCFDCKAAGLDGDRRYGSLIQDGENPVSASVEVPANRVFSNDWFKVGKSSLGGYGVFALKNIEAYTSILLEQPFICLKDFNTLRRKYEALKPEEKIVFDGLHPYAKNKSDVLVQKVNANSFMFGGGEGIFAIASNFNHACYLKRNTQYHWDLRRRVMVFTTDRPVTEGEELLISYGEGRMVLQEKFGFLCNCGSCDGPTGWKREAVA